MTWQGQAQISKIISPLNDMNDIPKNVDLKSPTTTDHGSLVLLVLLLVLLLFYLLGDLYQPLTSIICAIKL